MKVNSIVRDLYLQKWKKQGQAEAAFLLTPEACIKRMRLLMIRDVITTILISVGSLGTFILFSSLFFEQFNMSLRSQMIYGGVTVVLLLLVFWLKPGHPGNLTSRMSYDWENILKHVRQHSLLQTQKSMSEEEFFAKFEKYIKSLITSIKDAENKEEFARKARLKKRMESIYNLALILDLQFPKYRQIFMEIENQIRKP